MRKKRISIPRNKAFSSEVATGSQSNQVYADCVDLSAVENASKQRFHATKRGCFAAKCNVSPWGLIVCRTAACAPAWRTPVIFSTKARAEASQVCSAANSRQACGEILKAARQAGFKSS